MEPKFTVFIPTYNRARTLPRALESIAGQTCRDFEILIIDDGSTDGTEDLVREWKEKSPFPLTYIRQPNQGKHAAHNRALQHACGELTVILDSDDMLVPDALEIFAKHWDAIPLENRNDYAGIEGLCADMNDGTVAGGPFPDDIMDSDYFEIRGRFKVGGDKKNAVRTDLLKRYPFPRFDGEKHVRPSLLWKRLSMRYKFRYINEVVQLIEYQTDGLSADRFPLRVRNPKGFHFYYLEETNLHRTRYSLGVRWKNCIRYVRYSFHAGISLADQFAENNARILWLLSLLPGYINWKRDRIRMVRQGIGKTG